MSIAEFFEAECSCQLLEFGLLAYSEFDWTLSFDVETDAFELSLEGRPLQVEAASAAPQTDLPIRQLNFIGDWQITRAGLIVEAASQKSESAAVKSRPATELAGPD